MRSERRSMPEQELSIKEREQELYDEPREPPACQAARQAFPHLSEGDAGRSHVLRGEGHALDRRHRGRASLDRRTLADAALVPDPPRLRRTTSERDECPALLPTHGKSRWHNAPLTMPEGPASDSVPGSLAWNTLLESQGPVARRMVEKHESPSPGLQGGPRRPTGWTQMDRRGSSPGRPRRHGGTSDFKPERPMVSAQVPNSGRLDASWDWSRWMIDECICETRDSLRSSVAPISFMVNSS